MKLAEKVDPRIGQDEGVAPPAQLKRPRLWKQRQTGPLEQSTRTSPVTLPQQVQAAQRVKDLQMKFRTISSLIFLDRFGETNAAMSFTSAPQSISRLHVAGSFLLQRLNCWNKVAHP